MLYDCHIHCALTAGKGPDKSVMATENAERRAWFAEILAAYRAAEVQGLRDGGDAFGAGTVFRAMAEDRGIVFRTPIHALYKQGCYGDFLGIGIENQQGIRAAFEKVIQKKPDFIKIIQSGIMSFEHFGEVGALEFTEEELAELIDRAHQAGLKTMVHVNTPKGILQAIAAGADTVEHGYTIDAACIEALAETGTIWVPTIAPFANIAMLGPCATKNEKLYEPSRRYFDGHRRGVKAAYTRGVKIAPGSDAGCFMVPHAQGCQNEYGYLEACGIDAHTLNGISREILGIKE